MDPIIISEGATEVDREEASEEASEVATRITTEVATIRTRPAVVALHPHTEEEAATSLMVEVVTLATTKTRETDLTLRKLIQTKRFTHKTILLFYL